MVQENFFGYMMEHFAILTCLTSIARREIPETKRPVVNPSGANWTARKRSVKSKLTHRQARFAALTTAPRIRRGRAGQIGKAESGIGGSDRAVGTRNGRDQQPVENNAQPPRVWTNCPRLKSSSAWPPARKPTGRHREDDRLPRRDGDGFQSCASRWPGLTMPAACYAICFALRPTCCLM